MRCVLARVFYRVEHSWFWLAGCWLAAGWLLPAADDLGFQA
jgi:hypothetical protein